MADMTGKDVYLRVGLVHDLARALAALLRFNDLNPAQPGDAAILAAMNAYTAEHGPLVDPTAHDTAMAAKLPEYQSARDLMQSAVTNGERDLKAVDDAQAELDAAADDPEPQNVSDEDLTVARGELEQARSHVGRLSNLKLAVDGAEKKAQQAAAHHCDVTEWAAVAAALAPDGIPGEILAEALGPLNNRLAQSALVTEWSRVEIQSDMEIREALHERPYALLSESEKWRCDAMIAEAITNLSGLRLLVLDRVDVLDLQGRSDLLSWLDELAEVGELDSCLLFATLKGLPSGLPPTMVAHWIESGVVTQLKEAA